MRQGLLKFLFGLSVFLYGISAMSPVLVPFAMDKNGIMNTVGYVAGAMFWVGVITGSIVYIILILKMKPKRKRRHGKNKIPNVLRFFTNKVAIVVDSILIIGVGGTVFCSFGKIHSQAVIVFFLILLLMGIYTHCLFNGKIYQYICSSQKEVNKREFGKERVEK